MVKLWVKFWVKLWLSFCLPTCAALWRTLRASLAAGGYIFFAVPLAFGLLAKLLHSRMWFGDYQAIACAGQKVLKNAPLYSLNLQCAGMHPSSFVYIPGVAQTAAFFEALLTERGFFWLYLAMFVASLCALVWFAFFSRQTSGPQAPGNWRERFPFMVFVTGSAIMWGNVAVILHACLLGCALLIETLPWLFIASVAIASWVKPVFLTYLVVVLIADRPVRQRLALCATGLTAGLLPTLVFATIGGEQAQAWFQLLSHFVYEETPGRGFFGWLALLNISSDSLTVQIAYLVFAGLLTVSGLSLAEGLRLNGRERLWLGLSLAALLIPRVMSQDVFMLAPGLIAVTQKSAPLLARQGFRWGQPLLLSLCSLVLVGSLTNLADVTTPLALLGFSLFLLYLGQAVLKERRIRLLAPMLARLRAFPVKSAPPLR